MAHDHAPQPDQPTVSDRRTENTEAEPSRVSVTARQEALLRRQQTQGNQAVLRLLTRGGLPSVQRREHRPTRETIPNAPEWADDDPSVRTMQNDLTRLGLYTMTVDGIYGPGMDSALVEAFGGDEFRSLPVDSVVVRLGSAATPTTSGRRGDRNLRYGEMFRDGILDMTLGMGFDESVAARGLDANSNLDAIRTVLTARGFVEDRELATRLYAQAQRTLGPSAFGLFFVKENALTYTPPAAPPRQIHAVVRLVHSPDGSQGAAASQAFQEGMVQSDVSYYAGHGRYGSGPDFDRNYESFEYLLPDGSVERTVTDSHVLEHEMTEEGHHNHRSAWGQFLYRVNHTPPLLRVNSSNQGNVFVNPVDRQSNEFGARLMYWNLERTGSGQAPVTGQAGALGQAATAAPERRYRMVVFNGCNTRDYETSLRGTPGFDPRHADTLETTRTVAVADLINTLGVFLDSILGQQSAQQITREMDDAQTQPSGANRGTYVDRGSDLNPVVR